MPLFRSYMEEDAADADSQARQVAVTVRAAHLVSSIYIGGLNQNKIIAYLILFTIVPTHLAGIPFAQPPVGNLRFLRPQPLQERWEHIHDGSKYGAHCFHQMNMDLVGSIRVGQEDCLSLNVYVPNTPEKVKPFFSFFKPWGSLHYLFCLSPIPTFLNSFCLCKTTNCQI